MVRIVKSWKRPGGRYTGRVFSERLLGLPGDCSASRCAEKEASNGHMVCDTAGRWYVEFQCPVHDIAPKSNPAYEKLIAEVLQELRDQGTDMERLVAGDYEL